MKVLKVELEGLTTSFRYPHFIQGKQPTYEMPPPATIYGHICSVLGEWIDPRGLLIGYNFTYEAKALDLEHIHILAAKKPTKTNPIVSEGNVNPFKREFLFNPRLTLYLNRPEYYENFVSPVYPVILGRSQDLAYYKSIEIIELKQSEKAYFKDTIMPFSLHKNICKGIFSLMPRYIDYNNDRHPHFEKYLLLKKAVSSNDFVFENSKITFWVDETEDNWNDFNRGISLLPIVEE